MKRFEESEFNHFWFNSQASLQTLVSVQSVPPKYGIQVSKNHQAMQGHAVKPMTLMG